MKPAKSILDKSFRYRTAAQTDVRKTFERIRRQMKEQVIAPQIDPVEEVRRARR